MGFIALLNFSLLCIDFLAWPVIALGYPVFGSIRAIESGSVYHMRKMVIYWTLLSLISLFEYAFVKIIEWIPFWSSIKLVVIFWLVLPRFQGTYYSYQRFIRPCLVVNLQGAIESLYKPNEEQEQEQPLTEEMILDVVEKYLKENGSEALEKSTASKVSYKMDPKGHFNSQKDNIVMEPDARNVAIASKQLKEPDDDDNHKGKEMLKSPKKIAATVATKQYQHGQPTASFWVPKETTHVAAKSKDTTIIPPTETSAENRKPTSTHHPPLKNSPVEQEWTCPLCQVVTKSEKDLKNHLAGKMHKSMCESLKSSKLSALDTGPSSSTSSPIPISKKDNRVMEPDMKHVAVASKQLKEPDDDDDDDHKGKEIINSPKIAATEATKQCHHARPVTSFWVPKETTHAAPRTTDTITPPTESSAENRKPTSTHHPPLKTSSVEQEWTCPLCQVVTTSKTDLKIHLGGKKHKSMSESLKSSKLSSPDTEPSSTGKSSPIPKVKVGKNQVWKRIPEKI